MLSLSHLQAIFAVLANLSLDLMLLFACALFVGFLAAGLQLDDLDVLGKDWDFDVLGRRGFLGGVISNEVQLLAIL